MTKFCRGFRLITFGLCLLVLARNEQCLSGLRSVMTTDAVQCLQVVNAYGRTEKSPRFMFACLVQLPYLHNGKKKSDDLFVTFGLQTESGGIFTCIENMRYWGL